MNKFSHITLSSAALSLVLLQSATAAPGGLSDYPLQTAAAAKPNIMFHLDSSGSMEVISPTNIGTHTYTCSDTSAKIPDGSTGISLSVNTSTSVDGLGNTTTTYSPQISWNGSTRSLGNTSSTYCFEPTGTYTAHIDTITFSGFGSVPYKGAFLNWYFDTSTDTGSATWNQGYKPGAKRRTDVAKEHLKALLDTLKTVRVGLSSFNGSTGVTINEKIKDITTTNHLSNMKSSIDAVPSSGRTPLAESLKDLGRYFSHDDTNGSCGGGSTNLTIHPDEAATTDTPAGRKEDIACTTLLASSNVSSSDKGPMQAFCQKNFVVMLTDGLPTEDFTIPTAMQDYDGDCSADAQTAGSYTCDSADVKSNDPVLVSGNNSDYLDDVAQSLYEIDLRPDLNNESGGAVVNNVITYTIGFADLQVKNSNLLKDTATQGGGQNFYAEDADQLARAFRAAMNDIEGRSSTASAVTFNSSTLSSQSAVYQALFNTQRWSGELRSRPLDGFTGDIIDPCSGTNCWNASSSLDAQAHGSRKILTMGYDHTNSRPAGVPFRAPSDFSSISSGVTVQQELVDDLCAGPGIPYNCTTAAGNFLFKAINQAYINALVNYLRGDRTHESTTSTYNFRIRTNVLGDLVNSSPVYVGRPAMPWPDGGVFPTVADPAVGCPSTIPDNTAYSCWIKSSRKDRQPVVYVGANDGMLHGFSSSDGSELIAYVPTGVYSSNGIEGLHYLADPNYEHRFYTDLTPTVADVYVNHKTSTGGYTGTSDVYSSTDREWRTMLIGGQSAGGRSLFMLDVTDPSLFSESNAQQLVQWEFKHTDHTATVTYTLGGGTTVTVTDGSYLGYTFSKPTIAMMNNGKFAAIFGNGYNSEHCVSGLYVVYLEGGIDGAWTASSDYKFFNTGAGDPGNCNGMSTPALVDLDGNATVDRVYAGDLQGNLWAFDFCNWDSANSVCASSDTGWGLANASPIMTATDSSGVVQPITVKPVVSRDPASTGADDLIVVFGTGQYLTVGDLTTTQTQTMYGVRDYDAITNGRGATKWGLDPRLNADKFIEQGITEANCTVAGCTGLVRTITTPEKSIGTTDNGWLIDLPTSGERVVVNPKIRNNNVFFNTLIPEQAVCTAGGDGWIMSVNLKNGGIPLEPVFDLNNDGVIDGIDVEGSHPPVGEKIDAIPAESTFLGDNQYTPDSTGLIGKRKVNVGKGQREGRMSWREIFEDD